MPPKTTNDVISELQKKDNENLLTTIAKDYLKLKDIAGINSHLFLTNLNFLINLFLIHFR